MNFRTVRNVDKIFPSQATFSSPWVLYAAEFVNMQNDWKCLHSQVNVFTSYNTQMCMQRVVRILRYV
jgi:hypothetical protein